MELSAIFPEDTIHQKVIKNAVMSMIEKTTISAIINRTDFEFHDQEHFKTVIIGLNRCQFKVHDKTYTVIDDVYIDDENNYAVLTGSKEFYINFIVEQLV